LTNTTHPSNSRKKLKLALLIIVAVGIAITFVSGTAIFVYQMLRAG
jgi:hypothetical protein